MLTHRAISSGFLMTRNGKATGYRRRLTNEFPGATGGLRFGCVP